MSEILTQAGIRVAQLLAQKSDLEIELQQVVDELKALQTGVLVDEMLCSGMQKTKLENGVELQLKKEFYGGISYENAYKAADILTAKGEKFNWAVNIQAPDAGYVDELKLTAEQHGLTCKAKPDIAPQTFKKICRNLDAAGLLDDQTQQTLGVVTKFNVTVKTE